MNPPFASETVTVPARVDTRFRGGMSSRIDIDVTGLERRLASTVEGEVRFDSASRERAQRRRTATVTCSKGRSAGVPGWERGGRTLRAGPSAADAPRRGARMPRPGPK